MKFAKIVVEHLENTQNNSALTIPHSRKVRITGGDDRFEHMTVFCQVRENDLALFAKLAKAPAETKSADLPLRVVVPAFVTSELKTAFQIGFMVFVPFLIIDLVVASVLMSMGMMMVSPVLVSLPFKLMLFVLADGWNLLVGSLAASFAT